MKEPKIHKITVAELKRQLEVFKDDDEIFFGSDEKTLTFYRLKKRGENLVQVEFNQSIVGNVIQSLD